MNIHLHAGICLFNPMIICACVCLRKHRATQGNAQTVCFGSVRQAITVASKVRWFSRRPRDTVLELG